MAAANFAPASRAGDYSTIEYTELFNRLLPEERTSLIVPALRSGALSAYVQMDGDNRFFRIPHEFWSELSALDGEPKDTLSLQGMSEVPARFRDSPLLFFLDDVERWHDDLGPPHHIERDYDWDAFEECYAAATKPREGYWSAFATLSWIATRDERFVAATQAYEESEYADRGGAFTAAAWWTLGNVAGETHGRTFSDAEKLLREAIEANQLQGGIAVDLRTDVSDEVPRARWPQWKRAFENDGLQLVPGLRRCMWPAEAVRQSFPVQSELGQPTAATSSRTEAAKLRRFMTKEEAENWYRDRTLNWTHERPPARQEDIEAGRLVGLGSERVKELRRDFAPVEWKTPGRRPGT